MFYKVCAIDSKKKKKYPTAVGGKAKVAGLFPYFAIQICLIELSAGEPKIYKKHNNK
jgi:hypothetical protein